MGQTFTFNRKTALDNLEWGQFGSSYLTKAVECLVKWLGGGVRWLWVVTQVYTGDATFYYDGHLLAGTHCSDWMMMGIFDGFMGLLPGTHHCHCHRLDSSLQCVRQKSFVSILVVALLSELPWYFCPVMHKLRSLGLTMKWHCISTMVDLLPNILSI